MVIFIFYRIFIFVLGIVFSAYGITCLIIYLSLFSLGFSILDYLRFILSHNEIYFLISGLTLLTISLLFDDKWRKFIAFRKDRRRS